MPRMLPPFRWLFLLWAVCLLAACGDDEYHYPSVKLEFLTATTGADGTLQSVTTDAGTVYPVLVDGTGLKADGETTLRILSNYETLEAADGTTGVRLYASSQVVAPLPRPASEFEEGIKHDPAEVQSIWMGYGYLNIILQVKAQNGKHTFHFIEESVSEPDNGCRDVCLTLYHDAAGDLEAYTRRAYLSVPLRHYATEGVRQVNVHFSLHTTTGEVKTYDQVYVPK